jgi:hypothetical protein
MGAGVPYIPNATQPDRTQAETQTEARALASRERRDTEIDLLGTTDLQ